MTKRWITCFFILLTKFLENFNMVCALVCGLNMRSSMTAKITKGPPYCHHTFGWTPKPRKKIKILLHTYGLRKGDQRGILGDLWARFRLLICRFQTRACWYIWGTQGGKGNSEGKKVQQSLTSKLSIGMFMWFKIVKIKRIH